MKISTLIFLFLVLTSSAFAQITGSGTSPRLTRWSGTSTVDNSGLYNASGSMLSFGGVSSSEIGLTNNAGVLELRAGDGSTTLKAMQVQKLLIGGSAGTYSLRLEYDSGITGWRSSSTTSDDGRGSLKGTNVWALGSLIIRESDVASPTQTISIAAPSAGLSADYTLRLPTDDGTSNQVLQTDGSGNLSWVTRTNYVWVPAGELIPGINGGAIAGTREYATGKFTVDYFAMGPRSTSNTNLFYSLVLPPDYASNLKVRFYYSVTNTSSTTVTFGVAVRSFADSNPLDTAYSTAPTTITDSPASIAVDDLFITDVSSAITGDGTPAAAELAQFRIARDDTSGGGNVYVHGMIIQYER